MSTTVTTRRLDQKNEECRSHHQRGNPHTSSSASPVLNSITQEAEKNGQFPDQQASVLDWSIYALTDQGVIHYIGMSKNPLKRFSQHIHRAYSPSSKDTWIRGFLEHGMAPDLLILETVSDQKTAREREKYWIDFYSQRGPLLNYNLNTKQQPCGIWIGDPAFEEHAYQQIMREVGR